MCPEFMGYPTSFGFLHAIEIIHARASPVISGGLPLLGRSSIASSIPYARALLIHRMTF